jgi:hypothetical protein
MQARTLVEKRIEHHVTFITHLVGSLTTNTYLEISYVPYNEHKYNQT